MLSASPRRSAGARSATTVPVPTKTSASPTPVRSRRATSTGSVAAAVYPAIATAMTSDPTTMSGRRPRRSPKRPARGWKASAVGLDIPTASPTPRSPVPSGPLAYTGSTGRSIPIAKNTPSAEANVSANGTVTMRSARSIALSNQIGCPRLADASAAARPERSSVMILSVNRRLPVLLAVAVLVGALSTGCGGEDEGGPSPEDVVRESVEATGAVGSFHLTFDSQGVPSSKNGLQLLGAEGDVAVPDRVRADVSGTFAGVPLTTQLVAIGNDVWIKDPLAGVWRSVDVGTTPAFLLDPAGGVLGVMRRVQELNDEGTEELGGVETRRLRGTVDAADVAPLVAVSPGGGTVEATLWIGEEDRILRRVEVKGPVAENEPDDALRVIEISRLDEPVTVEPPEGAA